MADAFLSHDTEAAILKALDNHLSGRSFIYGEKMTTDDVKVFAAISGEPSSESYPNTIIWYKYIKNLLLWRYRVKAGWVSMDGQEASVEQSKEANAEDDVEETEEGEKAAEERRRPPKRKREEDDVGEETEKEAAEEAAKASENLSKEGVKFDQCASYLLTADLSSLVQEGKKPGMWSLEVVDAGEEMINRLEKNVPKLSTIVTDVKSAKLVYLSKHEGRKTVRIDVITTPFEDIDEEYSAVIEDFIHAVLFSDSFANM